MHITEWHERSFFIELKPRAEFASLFVDCPPHAKTTVANTTAANGAENGTSGGVAEEDDKENGDEAENAAKEVVADDDLPSDVVRVGEHWVVLEEGPVVGGGGGGGGDEGAPPMSFRARIDDLLLSPHTVCSPTWTDNHRLFMCKVHAESADLPLVPKTFSRLARDACATTDLEEFVECANGGLLVLECDSCRAVICDKKAGECSLGYLPSDDFLETSPGGDFYCRDTCGQHCDPFRHTRHSRDAVDTKERHAQWTPRPDFALLSHTTIVMHRETLAKDAVLVEEEVRTVRCNACRQPLGKIVKNHAPFLALHVAVTTLRTNQPLPYMDTRFVKLDRFFARMVLQQCEEQSSTKLVIRALDKTPHILVWLLEPYVVLTAGDLVHENSAVHSFRPFPALKMLYKVFDATSAARDPRANGEDASVGLVDVPLGCCLKFVECLLKSSHMMPPACRCVGQFYVGFMKLEDTI